MAKKKVKAKKSAATPETPNETFEEALGALETIVADLEGGELGLDQALQRYEEGVGRLKRCHAQLGEAERRIELLSGVDAEGNPVTMPFAEEGASADAPTAAGRSRKRSAGGGPPADGVDDSSRLF